MKDYIERRTFDLAQYFLLEPMATVRSTAKAFGIPKSTVYNDLANRLKEYPFLQKEVNKKLQKNKEERAKRGGEATRKKYLEERKDS